MEFVKENLFLTGKYSPMANLMLSVMGAFAEPSAPSSGLSPERSAELTQRAGNGVPKAVLARDYGISRETVYQYLRHAQLE